MSASTRQAVTAAGPIGRLLVGRIVRLTTTGEHSATTKLRVACVRCKMNDYNAHLKIYFTKQVDHLAVVSNDAPASTSGWEHPTKAALGDHVLMRHLSEPVARQVQHRVLRIVQRYGAPIDPVSGRRVTAGAIRDIDIAYKDWYDKRVESINTLLESTMPDKST